MEEKREAQPLANGGPVENPRLLVGELSGTCCAFPGANDGATDAVVAPPGHSFDARSIDRDCSCGFRAPGNFYTNQGRLEAWISHVRELAGNQAPMDSPGFPLVPPSAENPAPEIGSWVTCERDSIAHRFGQGPWGCFCINPVPAAARGRFYINPVNAAEPKGRFLSNEQLDKIARGLAEPDSESPAERAAYDRGWNDAIDVFTRNIKASNFERRRQ